MVVVSTAGLLCLKVKDGSFCQVAICTVTSVRPRFPQRGFDVHVAACLLRPDSAKVSLKKSRKRVDGHVVVGMSGEGAVSDRGWWRSPRTALRIGLV